MVTTGPQTERPSWPSSVLVWRPTQTRDAGAGDRVTSDTGAGSGAGGGGSGAVHAGSLGSGMSGTSSDGATSGASMGVAVGSSMSTAMSDAAMNADGMSSDPGRW